MNLLYGLSRKFARIALVAKLYQKRNAIKLVWLLLAVVIVFGQSMPAVEALSGDQKELYDSGINYYDIDPGAATNCAPTSATGGSPDSGPVYVVGDSISARTQDELTKDFTAKGLTSKINALVSRNLSGATPSPDGLGAITADQAFIKTANTVVVELGTNSSGFTPQNVDQMITKIRSLSPGAKIFWVDTVVVGNSKLVSSLDNVNKIIYEQSSKDNYSVTSWNKAVLGANADPKNINPNAVDTRGYIDNTDGLGVHPTYDKGVPAFATLVSTAVAGGGSGTNATPGNCACGSTSTTLSGIDNESKTWNFFKGKGLSDEQVAGIMGNIQQESSFVPEVMQIGGTSKDPYDAGDLGWGIIQWSGNGSTGRSTGDKFYALFRQSGLQGLVYELSTQLSLVWEHMNNNPVVTQSFDLSYFKQITDERTAATYFLTKIEGGSDPGNVRENNATELLKKYKGSSGSGGTSTSSCSFSSSSDCTSVTGTPKILCEAQKFAGLYYRWGGGHQGYSSWASGCPDPFNPPNNQPTGAPSDPSNNGLSGNPSPCALDCSGLVSVAVDEAFNLSYMWSAAASNGALQGDGSQYWKLTPIRLAKAGDIVTRRDHVEIVVSVNGTSITTFGTRQTGTAAGEVTSSVSNWINAWHWTGPGSGA